MMKMTERWREHSAARGTISARRGTSTLVAQAAEIFGLSEEGSSTNEARRWLRAVGQLTKELHREPAHSEVVERVWRLQVQEHEDNQERRWARYGQSASSAGGWSEPSAARTWRSSSWSNWEEGRAEYWPSGHRRYPQNPANMHLHDTSISTVPDRDYSQRGEGSRSWQSYNQSEDYYQRRAWGEEQEWRNRRKGKGK